MFLVRRPEESMSLWTRRLGGGVTLLIDIPGMDALRKVEGCTTPVTKV